jgi:hypothetical protein
MLAQIARVKDTPEVRGLYLSGLCILFLTLQPWCFLLNFSRETLLATSLQLPLLRFFWFANKQPHE